MDLPLDLTKLLYQELFCYQYQQPSSWPLENFSCNNVLTNSTPINCGGVPTRTTPTLTPTTLRNIEQTFMELQSQVESHQNEAGFVPPLLEPSTISSSLVSSAASSDLSGLDDGVSNHSSGDSAIMSGEESGPLSTVRAPSGNGSNLFMSVVDTKSWQGGSATVIQPQNSNNSNGVATSTATRINSNQHLIPPHVVAAINGSSVGSSPSSTTVSNGRRNTGGRRPNKENGLSAEEEERRKMRRERNKLAAARCRKRRLDHTNELIEETEELEGKKQKLQDEIEQLQLQKEELEFLLEAHKPCCKILHPDSPEDVKPFLLTPSDEIVNTTLDLILKNGVKDSSLYPFSSSSLSTTFSSPLITCNGVPTSVENKTRAFTCNGVPTSLENKPKARPSSLPVTSTFLPISNTSNGGSNANELVSCATGIPISTPSRGISLLTFDSLLEGGTGLTPLLSSASSFVPSCSSQQRNSNNVDLTSPESVPTKLVSL